MPHKKRILIIDDNTDLLEVLNEVFEEHNFECLFATTPLEGLKLATLEKPDIILLDLMLPDMSGLGVMHLIKNNAELKKIPVVILSSMMDNDVRWLTEDLGAIDYFSKGNDYEKMVRRIAAYAGGNGSPPPSSHWE
ncbi:MAG: response regulator [Deltaproteobacteria bacterium]|nr:response regulator [Deltaproteobacteria bacterium]